MWYSQRHSDRALFLASPTDRPLPLPVTETSIKNEVGSWISFSRQNIVKKTIKYKRRQNVRLVTGSARGRPTRMRALVAAHLASFRTANVTMKNPHHRFRYYIQLLSWRKAQLSASENSPEGNGPRLENQTKLRERTKEKRAKGVRASVLHCRWVHFPSCRQHQTLQSRAEPSPAQATPAAPRGPWLWWELTLRHASHSSGLAQQQSRLSRPPWTESLWLTDDWLNDSGICPFPSPFVSCACGCRQYGPVSLPFLSLSVQVSATCVLQLPSRARNGASSDVYLRTKFSLLARFAMEERAELQGQLPFF